MPTDEQGQEPISKEQRLSALENEISQAEQSLESNFAKYASENIDERMEELFFENKEEFIKQILAMQNEFLKQTYNPLVEQKNALQGEITQEKAFNEIEQAKNEFLQRHPDADMDALIALYNEELGSKYRAELDKLPPNEFFETLYQIMQQRNGGSINNDRLPKSVNANNGDVDDTSVDYDDMPMNRL